jgi:TolB-like protein
MIFTFNNCVIDARARELRRAGSIVPVEPQVFDLLVLLLQNRDRVVSKDELIEHVWNGRIVSDAALSTRIKAARRAVGDDGSAQSLLRTVRRRGYRFVGEVKEPTTRAGGPAGVEVAASAASAAPTRADGLSLGIMPFRCLERGNEAAYFLEGIVEAIRSSLARVKTFFVAARGSMATFQHSDLDVVEIAKILGVRYLVQGSMQKSGKKVRISVQLIDARIRQEIWSASFLEGRNDKFTAQDRVTKAIVGVLQPALLAAEVRRARSRQPYTATAYDLVLQAMPLCWALNKTDCDAAIHLLAEAIRSDPSYALAHALLSWCYGQQAVYNWTETPGYYRQQALGLARCATRLGNDDPLVLNMVASAECVAGDIPLASCHITRALQMDPHSAWAWIRSGYIHCDLGEADLALADFERALHLNPLDPMRHNALIGMGFACLIAGRYGEAIDHIERGLLENPEAVWAHREMAAAAAMLGDRQKARRSVAIVENYAPEVSVPDILDAIPLRCDEARTRLNVALTLAGFKTARARC